MKTKPVLITLWITCVCVLASFHFVHLEADFPNYSRWMDWAKYTDEGWYANAAIQHYLTGQWHVSGDLNTAVAVPVWPAVVWVVFHFTGVSIEAARALVALLFCGNLWPVLPLRPQESAKLGCALRVFIDRYQLFSLVLQPAGDPGAAADFPRVDCTVAWPRNRRT